MKDSAKSLGLDAVTAAVDAAKQANETAPKTDENGNTIDQAAQVDATKLVSPTEFINCHAAPYMEKNLGMPTDLLGLRMPARWSASITACDGRLQQSGDLHACGQCADGT